MKTFDFPDYVNDRVPKSDPGRSEGLHVSGVVESLSVKLGHLDPKEDLDAPDHLRTFDRPTLLRFKLGQIWEDWLGARLEKGIPSFHYHPGEISLDGITGTPDGIEYLPCGGQRVHEIKLTWISLANKKWTNRPGLVTWYHEAQIKCYLKMLGANEAVLHRLYLNHAYKPPEPMHWSIGLRFTDRELNLHWDMVKREAYKKLPRSRKSGKKKKRKTSRIRRVRWR